MGENTDYLGHVEIVPGLNRAEYDYLQAFSDSRRTVRPGGAYAIEPKDPDDVDTDRYNEICEGQPSYWCGWAPCPHGCCLGWNGEEKFYGGPAWLQYLIDHFLRPGALAQRCGDDRFAEFRFDHTLNGIIAGENTTLRELFLIQVNDNEVGTLVLRPRDPGYGEPGYRGLEDRPWLPAERPVSNEEWNAMTLAGLDPTDPASRSALAAVAAEDAATSRPGRAAGSRRGARRR